jgi:ABC-type nitrate/sulfonate/bicarbonate transport system substrate-binding protein
MLALPCSLLAAPPPAPPPSAEPVKITVQLDWVAEPEHGGFYQAQPRASSREGLEVTLIPGGPGAHVMPKCRHRQADIGQADSTNTLLQQAEGLPVVQFAAVFQDDPSGMLCTPTAPSDLRGSAGQDDHRPAGVGLPLLPREKIRAQVQHHPAEFLR